MTKVFGNFDATDFWDNSDYSKENYIGETLTDDLLESIEDELGYNLPQSYIELMRHQNGGTPKNLNHRTKEPTSWAEDHVAITGIFGINRSKSYSLCGGMGSRFWQEEWGYPGIGVYFCDCPSAGHDMICLDYRDCGPEGEPKVVHVDQELDDRITFVAENFEAFIRGLENDDACNQVELDDSKVKSVWINPEFAKQTGLDVPEDGWIKKEPKEEKDQDKVGESSSSVNGSSCWMSDPIEFPDRAIEDAERAVRERPDDPRAHLALARLLLEPGRIEEALVSAGESIRLDPSLTKGHALSSTILLMKKDWSRALVSACAGIELDPSNETCLESRRTALGGLGLKMGDEGKGTLALASRGFVALEKGEYGEALGIFREALRADPGFDWARRGIYLALFAHSALFRALDVFFHSMEYMPEKARILGHIVLVLAFPLANHVLKERPDLESLVLGSFAGVFGVLFLVIIPEPIHHLAIRLFRWGRWTLTPAQSRVSTTVAVLALGVVVCVVIWAVTMELAALFTGFGICLLPKPLAACIELKAGRGRTFMVAYTVLITASGLATLLLYLMGMHRNWVVLPGAVFLLGGYFSDTVRDVLRVSEK